MNHATKTASLNRAQEVELVTFHVNGLLMGVDIHQIEEINQQVEVTPVPHAPPYVRGVINLRGEVVTVVDLRTILGLAAADVTGQCRTVVVNSHAEQIGLLVDRIADVELASPDDIDPPPANLSGVDGRFFKGVIKLDSELLVVLDVDAVLAPDGAHR